MFTRTRSLSATLALALAACGGEPPPPPPVFVADSAADSLIVPVVDVATAVPHSDGSWALLAPMEGEIHVADFAADTVTLHPGITKDEVPGATALMHVGDTIIVGDWGLRRFTSWVPDGRRVDAVPTPEALRGAFPRARDAAGQWYFEMLPNPGRDGIGNLDSLAVVRGNPLLTQFDTVAMLAPIDHAKVDRDGATRYEAMPLSGRDYWGVQPDGTLWIARRARNYVEWIPPGGGKGVRTPGLPDPVYTVEEMDRQIWLRRYEEVYRTQVRGVRFAMIKPPVERAFAGADGRIWLFKSAPALDSVRSFQVVDSTGVRAIVQVPSRGNALGVTATHILMGEEFPEGIRLLRYRMPEGM